MFLKIYFCGGGGGVSNMEDVSTKNKTTRPDPKDIVKEYISVLAKYNEGKYAQQIMELQSHITKGTKAKEWGAILDKMAPLVAHELLSQLEALTPLGLIDTSSLRTSLLKIQQQQEDKKGLAALKGKLTGLLNNGQEEFHAKLKKHTEEAMKHGESAVQRSDCYRELMKHTKALDVKPEAVAAKEEMAHAAIFKGDLMSRSTLNVLKEWNSALSKEAGVDTGLDLDTVGSAAVATAPRRKRAPKATAAAGGGSSGGILPCDECGKVEETQKQYGSSGRIFCGTHFFREAILPRFKQLEETFFKIMETTDPGVVPDDFPEELETVTGPFDEILIQNGLSDHSEFNDPAIIDQLVKALQDAEKKLQLLPPPKDKSEEESFDVPERVPLLVANEEVEDDQVFETAPAAGAAGATNMVEVLGAATAAPIEVLAAAAPAAAAAFPRTPPPPPLREEEAVPAAPVKPKRGRKRVEREQEATPPESVKQCKLDDAWREALEYAREQNKKGKGQMLLDLLCDDNVEQVLAMKRQDPLETQQWIVVTVHNQDVLLSELFATQEEAKRHRQKVMVDTPYFSWHVKEVKKH